MKFAEFPLLHGCLRSQEIGGFHVGFTSSGGRLPMSSAGQRVKLPELLLARAALWGPCGAVHVPSWQLRDLRGPTGAAQ